MDSTIEERNITIDNYTQYTMCEIVEFCEKHQLCPSDWKLHPLPICKEGLDPTECGDCWKQALSKAGNVSPLALFESHALTVLNDLAIQEKRYKEIGESRAKLKEQLQDLMEAYCINKFENDEMSVSYVKARVGQRFDTTRFKKEHPDLYNQYLKETETAASVRFKVSE